MIVEHFLELVDIISVEPSDIYVNMVDIKVKDDESFMLANGIISHNSAAGSLKQARDHECEAVYALKGKVKNSKKLSDLSNNRELLEIMSILELEPNTKKVTSFDKVIIAADSDSDGYHITSLLINFFHAWFPHVIDSGNLYQLITPLVVCDSEKSRKYFYTLDEYNEFIKDHKVSNVNYLKGLGSLSLEDWQFVMENRVLFRINNDRSSKRFLDIAFGPSSQKRKKWLSSDRYIK